MTGLDELISPYGTEEFLRAIWGQRMEMLTGPADRFTPLLPWVALNGILRRHRLEAPRLRLARGGQQIPAEDYTAGVQPRRGGSYRRLRFDALAEQLRGGATLVIDSIDELYGPIDDLAAGLERALRERVQVNCYASFGAVHGFDTHWDDHDVLAVQVHGRKRWRVFGPTRAHPQRRDVEHPAPPQGDPVHDLILAAGSVLHVPRGWWHDATALEGPSVHLTFGVTSATGAELIAWLADDLRRHDLFRQDLPRFGDRDTRLRELADVVLGELSDPAALDRFFAMRDAQAPPRGYASLPQAVTGDLAGVSTIRLVTPRATVRADGDEVDLMADGRRARFRAPAAPVLEALTDGCWHEFAALAKSAEGLDEDSVLGLCADLVRLGFATFAPADPA
jgi:Cupin superfamily protein